MNLDIEDGFLLISFLSLQKKGARTAQRPPPGQTPRGTQAKEVGRKTTQENQASRSTNPKESPRRNGPIAQSHAGFAALSRRSPGSLRRPDPPHRYTHSSCGGAERATASSTSRRQIPTDSTRHRRIFTCKATTSKSGNRWGCGECRPTAEEEATVSLAEKGPGDFWRFFSSKFRYGGGGEATGNNGTFSGFVTAVSRA